MLDFMRRNARSWGIKVALGAIVLTFIFFMGGGGQIGAGPSALATVGDLEISRMDFELARSRNENYFRNQFQGQMNEQMLKALDIPSMTLRQLVDGATLRVEATRLGLMVPDDAVRDTLLRVSAFQRDGSFSPTLYRQTLQAQGLSPSTFEESVRRELLESQMADIVRRGAYVSEDEAWETYNRENRKITLSYVAVDSDPFELTVVTDEEGLQTFFEAKQEEYRRPASMRVRYLGYRVADAAKTVEVSEDEIVEYYELHKSSEFDRAEEVAARHILKRVDKDADEAAKKAAREAIEAVAAKIADGADFAETAEAESDDPGSAAKGGDLGSFGRGRMVPPFDAAAFSMEVGEVSDVVETDFGFHIIQVYDKQAAGVKPLEEVRDYIRDRIAENLAVDLVFERSAEDAAAIAEGSSLETIAEERGTKVEETPMFSDGDVVPGIGAAPAFVATAAALADVGATSDVVKVGRDYYILSLAERKDSYIPPLAEVREEVEKAYRAEKALDLARERADELLAELKSGRSLDDVAAEGGLEVSQTEPITESSQVVGSLGAVSGLADVAFRTTADGEPLARSFAIGAKAYVFVRTSLEEAEREEFETAKKETIDRLRTQRQQEALDEFVRALKEKQQIVYNRAQLEPLLGGNSPLIQ